MATAPRKCRTIATHELRRNLDILSGKVSVASQKSSAIERGGFLDPVETSPYAVTGNNRFRRAIHPSALSLSEVASVNHLRSRSAKSPDRFAANEVRA